MEQPVQPAPTYAPPAPLSPQDERIWASVAHFSIWVNVFTGFLGTVGALVIYLVLRDRSRYVAYQSLQALVFQLIAWVVSGLAALALWTLGGILSVICVGVLLFLPALLFTLLPVAALVYGTIAGIETYEGKDFKYWLIGDWVRSTLVGPSQVP